MAVHVAKAPAMPAPRHKLRNVCETMKLKIQLAKIACDTQSGRNACAGEEGRVAGGAHIDTMALSGVIWRDLA